MLVINRVRVLGQTPYALTNLFLGVRGNSDQRALAARSEGNSARNRTL